MSPSVDKSGQAALHSDVEHGTTTKQVGLDSGKALLANGPAAMHDFVASRLETALGGELPQMEVRFTDLSVSADITVVEDDGSSSDLPTLWNTVRKSVAGIGRKKQIVHKDVLKNVTGVFRPGTMTLVLGQPGSGKSSLMKVLSGRFPMAKNVAISGDMTYNGLTQAEIKKQLPQFVSYVPQHDKHFPTLTVRETLEYAHQFCGGELKRRAGELLTQGKPDENAEAQAVAKAVFDHYPEVVVNQLGLANCQDTTVGDALLRGVSGGEHKRVTTGEMEFGMKYMTLMDEISTGLDSAATFDIISTQRSIAHRYHKTVVIALLQPAPEVVALFDDLMILNAGEVMYHGPMSEVVPYFAGLGFECPQGRDVADYLMDLGTKQQTQYEVQLPVPNLVHPREPSDFARVFRESHIYQNTLKMQAKPTSDKLVEYAQKHMKPMPEFHQSFQASALTLLRRQMFIIGRNKPYIFGRALMITVMGLLYATTFYQFDPTEIQVVMGIIFAGTLFLSLGQASQLPTFMAAREIFYKQRGSNFFRTASYVVANSVSQQPLCITETLIFGTLVYWMCGFVSEILEFLLFLLVLFMTNFGLGPFFFVLTAAAPDINIATPISMASTLIFIIFAGFIITESQIPSYFIWLYWLTPVSWTLRALAIIEYRSSALDVCEYGGVDYCTTEGVTMGEYYLQLFDLKTEKRWIFYCIIYMAACYVTCMTLGYLALEYKRYETPENVGVSAKSTDDEGDYRLASTPTASNASKSQTTSEVMLDNLRYSVPKPSNPKESIELLKGISGFALLGKMTALMGASGAGKTTLMDVIANRKTGGTISGQILLNGYEANELAIRRCTGYCEQMDIRSEASTIREALTFSAFLRQDSSVPDSVKYDSVEECLTLLDMHDIADQIIRGSSTEQTKRLTIGVELAAQPSVLFLDEPTSGLDARSAKVIMDGVRKVADSGRTIVCTIHQPSSEVFFLFDSLLLLKRGGETVFFGELGHKCKHLCIGAGVSNNSADGMDVVSAFEASEQKQKLEHTLSHAGICLPSPDIPELVFAKKRAASSMTQMHFLTKRFLDMYWRSPTYNLTRVGMSVFLALLFGVTFTQAEYETYQGLNSGMGMLFMSTLFNGMISFQCVMSVAAADRPAFYRERSCQTYHAFWYFVGSTIVEIPYVFGGTLVYTAIFFPLVQFTGFYTFVMYWINTSLLILMLTYMGQMFVYLLPSEEVAGIIGVLINSRFSLVILGALVFADCPDEPVYDEATKTWSGVGSELGCQPLQNVPVSTGPTTVKQFTEEVFGMKHDEIWTNFIVVIAFIAAFRLIALIGLRFVNSQKR
ncbi:pleiotropic drug resistance protein ABC superfamily [Phytophthora sojae]|uniref:Pleiotropic drug resistance protein ABC superfamily n=1 Tax=Phytophthora sojae (strain P6497) TaxID=1094619 RepID=G4ZGC3_PHYSP|nr:pleiotropic drug resistance protein ABC superfamily [Phytophthora sojae]EGZ18568.1 pleiotropic drug resistance protein ABC superfamily [Phytophthora sojae]|eukprot:XP_009527626.1 pleiotropic drug resistance protein ABC superfamily [Phytophthora sojae]